jgi:IS5 family transposase
MSNQASFYSLAHKKKLRSECFLDEMTKVIPWNDICRLIQPYYQENEIGRKKTDLLLLLKIHFLQQWFNLSDPAAEEWIYDRISFQKFLNIDLMDGAPDETTILNFRHLLEKYELPEKIFKLVNGLLENAGLILKKGTIVDATIIAAPSSTKNKDQKRDPEMSSTKKNNNYYFGMKAHIGVDTKKGLVHSLEATTAKNSDIGQLEKLLHGAEKSIFGDKAYSRQADKIAAREAGVFYGITDKATCSKKLSNKQKVRNKKTSSLRAKVEHPFHTLKCKWGHRKTRYRGIFKNKMQLFTIFALGNLFRVRKILLSTV